MLLLLLACSSPTTDATSSTAPADTAPVDTAPVDTAPVDTAPEEDTAPTDTASEEDAELMIEQMHIIGDDIGEAALIIGPDGTTVLLDVGGESHAAEVLSVIDHHLPERTVDWVLLTHWHRDHVGGLAALLSPSDVNGGIPLTVRQAVISRGLFDVDPSAVHEDGYALACAVLTEQAEIPRIDLCEGSEAAGCALVGPGMPWPSSGCPGMMLGDLSTTDDDTDGTISHIPLGGGAELVVIWANGYLATREGLLASAEGGLKLGYRSFLDENARSIAGLVRWGDFTYLFGGDLAGGVGGSPDAESFILSNSEAIALPDRSAALPAGATDVLHIHHHGHNTATSEDWISWALPDDGLDRNAVIGVNPSYGGAVHQSVLERLSGALGNGAVWSTDSGQAASSHTIENVVDAAVVLTVGQQGAAYEIGIRSGEQYTKSAVYAATPRK